MKRIAKKYLVPHEENDWRPHLLRREATIALLVFAFFAELLYLNQAYVILPRSSYLASILPTVLVELTNGERSKAEEPALVRSEQLERAANLKAQDMVSKNYFAHVSPEGVDPWHWLSEVSYSYQAAGENLAVNFVDSEDVVKAWMNSPGHRKNILNGKFTEIGIGTARGTYKGRESIFVVQFFGKPHTASVKPVAVVSKEAPTPAAPGPAVVSTPEEKPIAQAPAPLEVQSAEMFIETERSLTAAMNASDTNPSPAQNNVPQNLIPLPSNESGFFTRLLVMPKTTLAYLYGLFIGLVAVALLLKLVVRMRLEHPELIANGLAVLGVALSILYVNAHFLSLPPIIF